MGKKCPGGVAHELRNPLGVMNHAVYGSCSIICGADAIAPIPTLERIPT